MAECFTVCAASLCTICEFSSPVVEFRLRGFCQQNTMDTEYALLVEREDGQSRPYFKGRMNTNIKWVSFIQVAKFLDVNFAKT